MSEDFENPFSSKEALTDPKSYSELARSNSIFFLGLLFLQSLPVISSYLGKVFTS